MTQCLASVFIATTLDGFIARADGALDWLPTPSKGNDMGYGQFVASVDVLVMGRHTYEKILSFGEWPYDIPVRVLTRGKPVLPAALEGNVEFMQGAPKAILDVLGTHGFRHAYIDGGETIQAFIAANLIQKMILTRVPVLIGAGLPLFGPLAKGEVTCHWQHVKTFTWANGLVQSHYEKLPQRSDS